MQTLPHWNNVSIPVQTLPSFTAIESLSHKSLGLIGKAFEYPIIATALVFITSMALTKLALTLFDKLGFSEAKRFIKEVYVLTHQYNQLRAISLVVAFIFARVFPIASFILASFVGINAGLIMDFSMKQKELEAEATKLSK